MYCHLDYDNTAFVGSITLFKFTIIIDKIMHKFETLIYLVNY